MKFVELDEFAEIIEAHTDQLSTDNDEFTVQEARQKARRNMSATKKYLNDPESLFDSYDEE